MGDESTCPECRARAAYNDSKSRNREKYNVYHKNWAKIDYQKKKEAGICTKCGKRKAMPGKKKCGICLAKDAERYRRNIDKPNIREYRAKNHLCYYCGNPIDIDYAKICKSCYERCSKNGKKGKAGNRYWKEDNKLIFSREKKEVMY